MLRIDKHAYLRCKYFEPYIYAFANNTLIPTFELKVKAFNQKPSAFESKKGTIEFVMLLTLYNSRLHFLQNKVNCPLIGKFTDNCGKIPGFLHLDSCLLISNSFL